MEHMELRRPQARQTPVLSAITLVPEKGRCSGQGLSCGSLLPGPGRRHEAAGLPSMGGGLWGSLPRTQPREDWAGCEASGGLRRLQADPGYIHSIPGQGRSTNLATAMSGEGDYLNG